ncbi:MAG TPA: diaminopropionate ammonia-lyase [Rhodopila sp.]|uniref:diaminopropionate ammonia-lyase n=1 Tax=Rhodopila sp. TaxID=2480087 RepID=UPI002B6BCD97|nr:diaminopropionate ammonia-lyase [Rhodopila sp.]HVY17495.1 diaminopropionate ammonia-lyase [Rhodopila sp.]
MTVRHPFRLFINPNHGTPGLVVLPDAGFRRARAAIAAWPGYAPTPLVDLPAVDAPGPGEGAALVRLKDEGPRFGLGSFKALGGAYAVETLVAAERVRGRTDVTVTCATDGNHGRSVAWGARRAGCRCVIFVHETVSQGRVDAIAAFGARVVRVPGNYDDAVREADRQAQANGWFVVSDTSYPGYTEVPRSVMQGYRVMADEAADQWAGPAPTHVFVQAGVGGAAAAVSVHLRARFNPSPKLVIVEPETAACLYESAVANAPTVVGGALETIMAGLACGEPSLLAWQELGRAAFGFMAIPDEAAAETLRWLAGSGHSVGESGVAGLAGYRLAAADEAARRRLGLTADSRVLVFGTEGVTDRAVYDRIRNQLPT